MTIEQQLEAGLVELQLEFTPMALEQLRRYLALLQRWNRVYNLTAIREPSKLVSHHLLDSLAVTPFLACDALVDVGSGAGLPGIPLAIARPELDVTLLDSNHKKGAFLRQAVIDCGLQNVRVEIGRAEAFRPAGLFDCAISRAFSDLAGFVDAGGPLVKPAGRLLAMKGVYPDEEIAQLPPSIALEGVHALQVPGLSAARHLVVLKRAA